MVRGREGKNVRLKNGGGCGPINPKNHFLRLLAGIISSTNSRSLFHFFFQSLLGVSSRRINFLSSSFSFLPRKNREIIKADASHDVQRLAYCPGHAQAAADFPIRGESSSLVLHLLLFFVFFLQTSWHTNHRLRLHPIHQPVRWKLAAIFTPFFFFSFFFNVHTLKERKVGGKQPGRQLTTY